MAPQEALDNGADLTIEATKLSQAQAAIDALIAKNEILKQGSDLGLVGTEGDSSGPHLHFQVDKNDGTPVNLFRWANVMQPGFTATGKVGGKTLTMHWDDAVMALVNNEEKIAMKRLDVVDGQGKATGAENIAFAWQNGQTVEQMQRIKWDADNNGWYQWNADNNSWTTNSANMRMKWTGSDFRSEQ